MDVLGVSVAAAASGAGSAAGTSGLAEASAMGSEPERETISTLGPSPPVVTRMGAGASRCTSWQRSAAGLESRARTKTEKTRAARGRAAAQRRHSSTWRLCCRGLVRRR